VLEHWCVRSSPPPSSPSKLWCGSYRSLSVGSIHPSAWKANAFDEARFGLINWHTQRYCPKGFRPPYIVRRSYK
jgi:hypothetical protein